MKEGFLGVTYPKLRVLREITFGTFRGLIFFAPALAAAPIGFFLGPRRIGGICAAIVVYYLLFNAAYKYWDGGWPFGPRHLAPALPFLALPLAFLWTRARGRLRVPLVVAAMASGAMTLAAVATTVQPSDQVPRPLTVVILPAFAAGDLALN